jgi:hypothetical protein
LEGSAAPVERRFLVPRFLENYGDPGCDEKLLAVGSELKGALLDYSSWRPASSIMLELIKKFCGNPAKTARRW